VRALPVYKKAAEDNQTHQHHPSYCTPQPPRPPRACPGCLLHTTLTSVSAGCRGSFLPINPVRLGAFYRTVQARNRRRFPYVASYLSAVPKTLVELFRCFCFAFYLLLKFRKRNKMRKRHVSS